MAKINDRQTTNRHSNTSGSVACCNDRKPAATATATHACPVTNAHECQPKNRHCVPADLRGVDPEQAPPSLTFPAQQPDQQRQGDQVGQDGSDRRPRRAVMRSRSARNFQSYGSCWTPRGRRRPAGRRPRASCLDVGGRQDGHHDHGGDSDDRDAQPTPDAIDLLRSGVRSSSVDSRRSAMRPSSGDIPVPGPRSRGRGQRRCPEHHVHAVTERDRTRQRDHILQDGLALAGQRGLGEVSDALPAAGRRR